MKRNFQEKFLFFALFTDEKRGKSQQGGLAPSSFRTSCGVHESVVQAMRGKCVRQGGRKRTCNLAALRNLNHTTRANISHEIAEQIRAHIVCTPAEKRGAGVAVVRALTKSGHFASLLLRGIDRFAKQTRSASPRLGQKAAREA